MFELTLARAATHEEPWCGALLAELHGRAVEPFVARVAGAPVGAVAIRWANREREAQFPLHVHVLPAFRGKGFARRILDRAEELVAPETDALRSFGAVEEGSEQDRFARACGFAVLRRKLHFQMAGAPLVANLEKLLARLEARGRGPEFKVVPVREAPLDDVALLVAQALGTLQPRLAAMLAGAAAGLPGTMDLDRSVAVMDGPTVAGALIYRWNDGQPVIEANAVAPAYRAGPANLLQLLAATKNGLAGGAHDFTYICDETVTDSVNLARRGGGTLLKRDVELVRPVRR